MTDDGCQTTPQEVDDAAEALATFSRGAVNAGGTTYATMDETPDRQAQGPLTLANSMPPPVLQTFFPDEAQSTIQKNLPDSPRLKPQPSESLPLVSPLVSKSLFGFAEPILPPPSLPQQNRDEDELTSEAIQASIPTAEPADEDLYSASPKRGLEVPVADFSGLQNPLLDANALGGIGLEGQFISENQYGEWQRDTANLSYASSPFKQPEHPDEMVEDERFYVEPGHEAHQFSHGSESQQLEEPSSHQYPDLDELSQHHIPVWGGHAIVPYPDLPEPDDRIEDNSRMEPPLSHSAPMSREHSDQSHPIDLTESSDEGEDQEGEEEEEDVAQRNGSDAGESEGSIVDEDEEMPAGDTRSRYFQSDDRRAPEQDYNEDEEGYYEDEFEEDEDGSHASRGDYYEDEESEGSYDEDMEEDEGPQTAPVQRDPVVIDLLSSDDEDAGDMPAPKQPTPKPQQVATRPEPASDEESDEDEDMQDDIDDRTAEETKPRQGSIQRERQRSYQSNEEDESDIEDEKQDHPDTRMAIEGPEFDDEDASHGSESDSEVEADEHSNDFAEKENQLPQKKDDQMSVEDDSEEDASPEPEKRKPSLQAIPPILYPRSFGMDGAYDEHAEEHPSERISENGKASLEPGARRNNENGQLPTPDDTQRTEKVISPEASFSASQDPQVVIHEHQIPPSEAANLLHEISTAGAGGEDDNVESTQTSMEVVITEPASISEDTSKLANQEVISEDVEPETEETIIEEIVEKAKEEALEDIAMEEHETEETIIEEIVETAREEALEELSNEEKAADDLAAEDVTEETIIEEIVETAREEALEEISKEKIAEDEPAAQDVTEETMIEEIVETAKEEALEEMAQDELVAEETTEKTTHTPEPTKVHVLELQQQHDQPPLVSPRRSSRLVKPALDLKENVRPSTPNKAAKGVQQTTAQPDHTLPMVAVDEQQSSPQGHDASVELALASHDSPQKRHNLRRPSTVSIDSPTRQHNLRNAPSAEVASPPSPRNLRKSVAETESSPPQHNLRKHSSTDNDATSKHHDLRKHTVAATSPQVKQHDLPKSSVADLKLKLSRTLRTKLSEFTALKVLRYHLNAKLDILAVATTTPSEPQRTKSTSRQFLTTFHVTDVSIGPSAVTEIQVYRPYKDALPVVQAGDGILLRNFQVISVKNKGFGLRSEETSSWAVFKDDEEPEMRGPPVEMADEEKNHMVLLKQWYGSLDAAAMAKLARANADKGVTT